MAVMRDIPGFPCDAALREQAAVEAGDHPLTLIGVVVALALLLASAVLAGAAAGLP